MLAKLPLKNLGSSIDFLSLQVSFILTTLHLCSILVALHKGFFRVGLFMIILTMPIIFFLSGLFSHFGFYKYFSLLLFLDSVFFLFLCYRPWEYSGVLVTFAGLLSVYGLISGFEIFTNADLVTQRVRIGLNGPIVFSQLMLVASYIILLHSTMGFKKRAAAFFFLFSLSLLGLSKGPLLSGLLIFLLLCSKRKKLASISILFAVPFYFFDEPSLSDNRLVSAFALLLDGNFDDMYSGTYYGTFGSRLDEYALGLKLALDQPLGIGIGAWGDYSRHDYPHNLIIELMAEMGLLLGSIIVLASFLLALSCKTSQYLWLIILTFLFSMTSGSILDNRLVFGFILLMLLYGDTSRFFKRVDYEK